MASSYSRLLPRWWLWPVRRHYQRSPVKVAQHPLGYRYKRHPVGRPTYGSERHDVNELLPLVDNIPPVRGKRGYPRSRPDAVQADTTDDSESNRSELRKRGITPLILNATGNMVPVSVPFDG